jgi:hypothetical protein
MNVIFDAMIQRAYFDHFVVGGASKYSEEHHS